MEGSAAAAIGVGIDHWDDGFNSVDALLTFDTSPATILVGIALPHHLAGCGE